MQWCGEPGRAHRIGLERRKDWQFLLQYAEVRQRIPNEGLDDVITHARNRQDRCTDCESGHPAVQRRISLGWHRETTVVAVPGNEALDLGFGKRHELGIAFV